MLRTFSAMWRSQTSSEVSSGPPTARTPTLLCRMSMRPYVSRQCSTKALTSSALDTSATWLRHSPPSFAMMPFVSSTASSRRSTAKTLAPSRANRTAVALPFPQPGPLEPAPVTIATLFLSRPAMDRPFLHVRSKLALRFLHQFAMKSDWSG